jgi:hypothetical protein
MQGALCLIKQQLSICASGYTVNFKMHASHTTGGRSVRINSRYDAGQATHDTATVPVTRRAQYKLLHTFYLLACGKGNTFAPNHRSI